MSELVKQDERAVATSDPGSEFLAMIWRAAKDPTVDVSKVKELLEMKERLDAKDAQVAFNQSMKDAQEDIKPVVRDAENQHTKSKYARLETIDNRIRPIYTKHGFSLSYNSPKATDKDLITVSCSVLHQQGHSRDYELSGPPDAAGSQGKANKTGIQALGSSVSYLRRYLVCMIFNIVLTNEDDDGNGGYITPAQANAIEDRIQEIGLTEDERAKFLEFMGVKAVEDLQRGASYAALSFLNAKGRQKAKQAEEQPK